MIKYPSIGQFKNVIKTVAQDTRYFGKDENGDPLYNNDPLPTLEFIGSQKFTDVLKKIH